MKGAGTKPVKITEARPPSERPSEKRIFTDPRELFKTELVTIQDLKSESSYEVLKYPISGTEQGVEVTRHFDAVAIPLEAFVKYAEQGQIPGVREAQQLPKFFDTRGWKTEVLKEGPFTGRLCVIGILSSDDMLMEGDLPLPLPEEGEFLSYAEVQKSYGGAPPTKKVNKYAPERVAGNKKPVGKEKLIGDWRFADEVPKLKKKPKPKEKPKPEEARKPEGTPKPKKAK